MSWWSQFVGKKELMKLGFKYLRKVFRWALGQVYNDIADKAAIVEGPSVLGTAISGPDKAQAVVDFIMHKYPQYAEYRWIINIVIELIVAEMKGYDLLAFTVRDKLK